MREVCYNTLEIRRGGLGLTERDIRAMLADVKCFLLDMDGTFYLGDRLLDGSLDFLQRVKETGRSVLFVTNNSSKSADMYVQKLLRLGVPAEHARVLTSGQAAGQYVLAHFPGQKCFLMGNPALRAELAAMGVPMDDDHPDYVLAGFDTTLDYAKLTRVCDLVRAGLPLIATHPDYNCPTETGFIPDLGSMLACIEASAGRRPDVIIGKPNAGLVEAAMALTGLPKSALAIAGDRLYTDIATGARCGLTSILVLTGEATRADIESSEAKPDITVERLASLNAYL